MLFDVRSYTCKPGTLKAHIDLYEKEGFAAQCRHLGKPYFYCITETGPLNTYIHIWAYDSAADREQKRAAMQKDPEWTAYLKHSAEAGYLIAQENRLMTTAPFFTPVGGQ